MTLDKFLASLDDAVAPKEISKPLEALWYDKKGDWNKAHAIADGPAGLDFKRVHAYLHRKEGDLWNADYWYRQSNDSRPSVSLDEEWLILVKRLLKN